MQKQVAIKLRIEGATGRTILAGILKRIKGSERCAIHIASDADDFRRLSTSASALIADTTADVDTIQKAIAAGKPIVLLNDWRFNEPRPNLGHIRTDDEEIGSKAADYLLSIGRFRSFGYVPAYADRVWSTKRGHAFALQLKRKGHECLAFSHGKNKGNDLSAWLKTLPKPTAVFCAWDAVAAEAASAATRAKIRIPSQMVLLGVDNDECYSTSTSTQISSIEFDAENEGHMAMSLLLKMMQPRKGKLSRIICCGSVKQIVERESTRPPTPAAYLIERALKFISENATKGIGPQDVVTHLGISRTLLDLRFRETGNKTVGRLILERKLNALAALISKTRYPLHKIIKQCGFGDISHAKVVFKKRFGMTMREYRTRSRSK